MNEVPRDEVADTRFGEHPAIESLAFVVDALRSRLEQQVFERDNRNTDPYRNWARFKRRRRP